MAIASFIVQTGEGRLIAVQQAVQALAGVASCGPGDLSSLVVVVERHSQSLPEVEGWIRAIPGVLSVSTAFLSIEDELEGGRTGT